MTKAQSAMMVTSGPKQTHRVGETHKHSHKISDKRDREITREIERDRETD